MKTFHTISLSAVAFLFCGSGAFAEVPHPHPEAILNTVRHVTTLQNQQDLNGYIRKKGWKARVALFLRGKNLQFQFQPPGTKVWGKFHMRLAENHYDLFEIRGTKTYLFDSKKLGQPILNTDLTYEDLALRFLYWPNPEFLAKEKVQGRASWKLRIKNPNRSGRYGFVYVWVDQQSGALMKVIGFNFKGKPLKRFTVTKVMKIGKAYTVRQMRIDSTRPQDGRVTGVTYLEFDKPKRRRQPRGLR